MGHTGTGPHGSSNSVALGLNDCDLCGLAKSVENNCCPQHEMWRLQQEVKRLRAALFALVDEQNGPPLIRHQKHWLRAMRQAYTALGETESANYYQGKLDELSN